MLMAISKKRIQAMNKTEAKTCNGCIARTSVRGCGGCVFGFMVERKRTGFGYDSVLVRTPLEPCFKALSQRRFDQVGEYLERRL